MLGSLRVVKVIHFCVVETGVIIGVKCSKYHGCVIQL